MSLLSLSYLFKTCKLRRRSQQRYKCQICIATTSLNRHLSSAKSTGFVKHCRFENEKWTRSVREEEDLITAAEVVNESSLTCEHSFFRGFEWVVQASGSHSTACFSSCVATNVYQVATVDENANLNCFLFVNLQSNHSFKRTREKSILEQDL